MSTSNPGIAYTYEDYKSLAESSDRRYELIDGGLYMTPSPTARHQAIIVNLLYLLEHHVRATRCGCVLTAPLDVVLGDGDERSVVQPDIVFIPIERAGIVMDEIVGAPGLIVEVLSPGTASRDRRSKKSLYARSGVDEYWIVDPWHERIEVYRQGPAGYLEASIAEPGDRLVSTAVPGLQADVAEVFRDLLS